MKTFMQFCAFFEVDKESISKNHNFQNQPQA